MTSGMMKLAFLGTGLMGAPMARHLAGYYEVTVWNRSREKAEALADVAKVADSPRAAAEGAEIVISMLLDGPASREVLQEGGVIDAAAPHALIINMASVEPDCDRALAEYARARGRRFVDAPVSGGVKGAEAQSLAIFAGGREEDVEAAWPVLELLGRPTHMGPVGTGQTAKLANQLIVAITIGAVAEAFRLAEAADCDPAQLRSALKGGFADSRILDLHGERMVTGNFTPGGRSVAQLKDLNNALAVADAHALSLPLSQTVQAGFDDFVKNHDGGELDHAAYYLWLKQRQD
ncbi:NAD(P)-dependent oxidoreductase [Allorhizobium sp. BGMRC 0089]|uniref:NAD(P)-dependent oxidoreductase n=1 Tax=Allorhizobium sonneratiae TaxID=2934936 RepID=UPI002033C858|nr:NAD(P)-dependent oxidoreductase [Allorhizobium sonneratiae]MCM2292654.1 NAD(P)-dependent oxidoreductase [Allorhizobium sonneratiae]